VFTFGIQERDARLVLGSGDVELLIQRQSDALRRVEELRKTITDDHSLEQMCACQSPNQLSGPVCVNLPRVAPSAQRSTRSVLYIFMCSVQLTGVCTGQHTDPMLAIPGLLHPLASIG
jgi:hypothetical protein